MLLRRVLFGIILAICMASLHSNALAQSASDQPVPEPTSIAQPNNPLTGPSFPCPQPLDPLAQLICLTPQLALLDMQLMQPFEALKQQVGVAGRSALLQQAIQFDVNVRSACNISLSQASDPSPTPPPPAPPGAAQCVIPLYQQQIAVWHSRLQGAAAEEATRPIQEQLALQSHLQALGFLPATAKIDGVFGTGTRAAIIQWQTSVGRQPTGLLGNADAQALLSDLPQSAPSFSPSPSGQAQTPAPSPITPTQSSSSVETAWGPYTQYAACMLSKGFQLQTFVQDGVMPTDAIAASVLNSCIEMADQQQTPTPTNSGDTTDNSSNSAPSGNSGGLNVGDSVTEGPLKITVTKVEYLSMVGNDIINHPAPQNGTLVAIQYTFTNISGSPVDSSSQPDIHLLDDKGVSYDSDIDATSDYETQIGTTQKIVSDLNPGITTIGAGVFEVSLAYFNSTTWHIYFGDDQNDLISMPSFSNQGSQSSSGGAETTSDAAYSQACNALTSINSTTLENLVFEYDQGNAPTGLDDLAQNGDINFTTRFTPPNTCSITITLAGSIDGTSFNQQVQPNPIVDPIAYQNDSHCSANPATVADGDYCAANPKVFLNIPSGN